MTAGIVVLATVVGVALAVSVLALLGAARGKKTPPMPGLQPFSPATERAITQAMAVQDQPIYMAGAIDELAKRRDGAQ